MDSTNPIVFKSIDSILNVLNSHKDNPNVTELLNIYELTKKMKVTKEKKYPFIVLEGLDGCGKSSMSRSLSKHHGAKLLCTPPKSISHLRSTFDDSSIRTAFYSFGNYIAAEEIRVFRSQSPVILDRYWHSTASYALAQAMHDKGKQLPPIGDEIYTWPIDLLQPDLVIFLDVNEENRLKRISRRQVYTEQESLMKINAEFRNNIITAYERMVDPKIVKVDSNFRFDDTLDMLLQATEHLF